MGRGRGRTARVGSVALVLLALVGHLGPTGAVASDPDGDRLRSTYERQQTRTDPRDRDTDRDGIPDGAEDADGDDVSNAGEQRLGTDPYDPDTDGDALDDWHEDSDADGVADGRTQDRRSIPSGLRPTLGAAYDRPAAHVACHQRQSSAAVKACLVAKEGPVRVVLFGDSHALQWRRPVERLAKARGWRVWSITKSACPVADIPTTQRTCRAWRSAAIRRIAAIRPSIVIVGEHVRLVADDGTIDQAEARRWRAGMTRTLRRLDRAGDRVFLLGDTSKFGTDPVRCLRRHRADISACSVPRAVALSEERVGLERAAAFAAGVRYRRTDHLSCPYDPCPVVIERVLVAYDSGHMTMRYATGLWRGLGQLLPRR